MISNHCTNVTVKMVLLVLMILNHIYCSCADGFKGNHCELNIDDCKSNPCQNDATCIDGIANYTCSCADGFEGDTCEIDIDDCLSNPCQNDGTCIDGIANYTCHVLMGMKAIT